MDHVTRMMMHRSLARRTVLLRRTGQMGRRPYANAAPPPPPNPSSSNPSPRPSGEVKEGSRVGSFYKSFGSPVLKSFLGALFTYQVIYWAWLKLETLEAKAEKEAEIHSLKSELKAAVLQQKETASEKLDQGKEKVKNLVKKGSW
ncbi:hypothetical protein BDV95DRAFT_590287 [Massariosphaeria phaeospora]|uniref:Uncharacterized protein n=1 Tax=Massariosphaeria phaeospora TaxID=100035 RepID=A0A7C8MI80_9PLEO|nr:hypothetical protein BDV95DRAFT_590287 [Massariosphaeria phaeospora]